MSEYEYFNVGDVVQTPTGEIGIVEVIDDQFVDVEYWVSCDGPAVGWYQGEHLKYLAQST